MDEFFSKILEMSLYGSIAVLIVMIFRGLCRKMPKSITTLMWSVPLIRLLCPVNPGMKFGIMNLLPHGTEEVSRAVPKAVTNAPVASDMPAESTHELVTHTVHSCEAVSHAHAGAEQAGTLTESIGKMISHTDVMTVLGIIWLAVSIGLIVYVICRYISLRRVVRKGIRDEDGAVHCRDINVPFVYGLFRPVICIPDIMNENEKRFILLHESTHIRNLDHITKFIGLIAVCIHWFNPIVWMAFLFFSRDLEMRVDERVIDRMGNDIRKDYCLSLVSYAGKPSVYKVLSPAFADMSFGGSEVKMRIKNIIGKKKISKKISMTALIAALMMTTILSSCATKNEENKEEISSDVQASDESTAEDESSEEEISEDGFGPGMVMGIVNAGSLGDDNQYVSDYGAFNGSSSWSDIESASAVSADSFSDEDILAAAEDYESDGQTICDIDAVNGLIGGTGFNEGFVTVSSGSHDEIILVVKADGEDIIDMLSGLDDSVMFTFSSGTGSYYLSLDYADQIQGDSASGPLSVSIMRDDTMEPDEEYTYDISNDNTPTDSDADFSIYCEVDFDDLHDVACFTFREL